MTSSDTPIFISQWAKVEGDIVTVGITDHAQAELGDVVYVELPEVGSTVSHKATFGVVESVKVRFIFWIYPRRRPAEHKSRHVWKSCASPCRFLFVPFLLVSHPPPLFGERPYFFSNDRYRDVVIVLSQLDFDSSFIQLRDTDPVSGPGLAYRLRRMCTRPSRVRWCPSTKSSLILR